MVCQAAAQEESAGLGEVAIVHHDDGSVVRRGFSAGGALMLVVGNDVLAEPVEQEIVIFIAPSFESLRQLIVAFFPPTMCRAQQHGWQDRQPLEGAFDLDVGGGLVDPAEDPGVGRTMPLLVGGRHKLEDPETHAE